MKYLTIILLFFTSILFGQQKDSIKEIGNGKIIKKYNGTELESFEVEMYATNYGNVISFTKTNDTIFIKIADESDITLKIFLKNKMQVNQLLYKNKELSSFEYINFNLKNLPKNSIVSRHLRNGKIESYISKSDLKYIENVNFDKSVKVFLRLDRNPDLTDINSIFNSISDFFSKEDALYMIFLSSYADKLEPLIMAYLKTNEQSKIKAGIIWSESDSKNGKYEIYNNGKVIKSGIQKLEEFQKTIIDYFEKNGMYN